MTEWLAPFVHDGNVNHISKLYSEIIVLINKRQINSNILQLIYNTIS